MKKNDWMTRFYGKTWWEVEDGPGDLQTLRNSLVEWRISAGEFQKVSAAQRMGFELVETFAEFVSRIEPSPHDDPEVCLAEPEHLEEIQRITEICLVEDDSFYTRFKNRDFFSEAQCASYYQQLVTNSYSDDGALTAVAKDESGVCGYYMLKRTGEGIYKGMLTGVLPRARGKSLHIRMQRTCFAQIKNPFTVVNTTQLHNLYTINSHIRQQRTLASVTHIFFLNV